MGLTITLGQPFLYLPAGKVVVAYFIAMEKESILGFAHITTYI